MSKKKRLTVPEAATELGSTARHVYNLLQAGHLSAICISVSGNKTSAALRISGESLAKFIESREVSANSE